MKCPFFSQRQGGEVWISEQSLSLAFKFKQFFLKKLFAEII